MSLQLIEARKLNIRRANKVILRDVHFDLFDQEWVEIIGPNQSGKTSLIEALYGLNDDLSGSLNVLGYNLNPRQKEFQSARRKIGLVSSGIPLIEDKTVRANLAIAINAVDKIKELNLEQLMFTQLKKFGLDNKSATLVRDLSESEKILLKLSRAFLNAPRLMILDGIFEMLDDAMTERVKSELLICLQKEATAILLTSLRMTPFSPGLKKIFSIENAQLRQVKSEH